MPRSKPSRQPPTHLPGRAQDSSSIERSITAGISGSLSSLSSTVATLAADVATLTTAVAGKLSAAQAAARIAMRI